MTARPKAWHPAPGDAAKILDRCTPADFDGHTAFLSFTPEQRLDALGQMIAMVVESKGKAAPSRGPRSASGPQL
jgi:hypothetical protein